MVTHWCLLGGLVQQSVVSERETNQMVNYVHSVHCKKIFSHTPHHSICTIHCFVSRLTLPVSCFRFTLVFLLPLDRSLRLLQDRLEVNGPRLKISNLALEDSGMYQCVAENKHGTIYSSAELRVQGSYLHRAVFILTCIKHLTCFLVWKDVLFISKIWILQWKYYIILNRAIKH